MRAARSSRLLHKPTVGIYNRYARTAGGGEKYSLAIADVLEGAAHVDLLTHDPIDVASLARRLRLRLTDLGVQYVDDDDEAVTRASERYDLFINASYMSLVPSRAGRSVALVYFPNPIFASRWALQKARVADQVFRRLGSLRRPSTSPNAPGERSMTPLQALGTYDATWAVSEYSRRWIQRYWARDAQVLYPPVDVDHLRPAAKLPLILSVGRFFRSGHSKRQDALVEAVRALGPDLAGGWNVVLAGGIGHAPSDWRYFQEVEAAARGLPVTLWPNVPVETLAELYAHAAVYWHAAGFGRDEHTDPARMEHFGITTVEAMAAGCVPLVYDAGGQAEIVEPGVDGYRWRTLPELVELTRTVIADASLRARLARAATLSARRFSGDLFTVRVTGLVAALLDGNASPGVDAVANQSWNGPRSQLSP